MSARADQHQIRRWQDEVASDPGAPSFLPLAEVYRREGRADVARRLCLRGLQRYPENVDAHFLLGRLYREAGELENALDEWSIAVRLDPRHTAAHRALGYLYLERREWAAAVRHLEPLAAADPADDRVASALAVARRQQSGSAGPRVDDPEALRTAITQPLERFARAARVDRLLVCEPSGRVLTRTGFADREDVAAFATLGAGIQAASAAIARLLGQPRFDQLYQGAGDHQIFMAPVQSPAGELLLLTVFGSDTNIGLVRVRFRELTAEVDELPLAPPASATPTSAAAFEADLASGLTSPPRGGRPRLLR